MVKINIKITKIRDVETPRYAHQGDAGMDLFSAEDTLIKSGERIIVPTGIKIAIPLGYVGLIWDRSGLAAKNSLHCLAGVIDSGYRGEIGIVMVNLGDESFNIMKNMRIAQMLIQPIVTADLMVVDDLTETSRNEGGFGSTGLK